MSNIVAVMTHGKKSNMTLIEETGIDFGPSDAEFLRMMREADGFIEPPKAMTVDQFADENIVIAEGNASPGPFRTDRTEYMREPMREITNPDVRNIVLCWASQLGKTQMDLNALAYYVAHEPSNIVFMQPTKDDIDKFNETKLEPAIEANPLLNSRFAKKRSIEGKNTKYLKTYPGGAFVAAWSNSTSSARGISAPIVITDEGDEYPMTTQGHPANLLWKRATTFGSRAIHLDTCTPTTEKGYIWQKLLSSDFREYWVQCPHCGEWITFQFPYLKFDRTETGSVTGTPYYACNSNGCVITDSDKIKMVKNGRWIAKNPFNGVAGFHLNALYSPFVTFESMALDYVAGKKSGDTVSFYNTGLALPVIEKVGEETDWKRLFDRREDYLTNTIPPSVLFLTAAVDIQKDRLELEIKGWNENQECFAIDYRVIPGSPVDRDDPCWAQLDELLDETWPHMGFDVEMQIRMIAIDAGYLTDEACAWGKKHRRTRRVMVLRGRDRLERILNKPSEEEWSKNGKKLKRGVKIWRVGTNKAKTDLFNKLDLESPVDGKSYPFGYMHFPKEYDDNYFKGLTAEVLKENKRGGTKWEKIRDRNEPIDLSCYNRAAFVHCGGERFNDDQWRAMRANLANAAVLQKEAVQRETEAAKETVDRLQAPPKKRRKSSHFDRLNR